MVKIKLLLQLLVGTLLIAACQIGDHQVSSVDAQQFALYAGHGEHHIGNPSDKEKKEQYDKEIKDKIVKDQNPNEYYDQKQLVHSKLAKLPMVLTKEFMHRSGKIELILGADQWQNKTSTGDDQYVYYQLDNNNEPIVYVNANKNYATDANSRKDLYSEMLNVMLEIDKVKFDRAFVEKINFFQTKLDVNFYYPQIEAFFKDKLITLDSQQQQLRFIFADLMANYLEYGANYPFKEVAAYLDDFEKEKLPKMLPNRAQRYISQLRQAEQQGIIRKAGTDVRGRLHDIEDWGTGLEDLGYKLEMIAKDLSANNPIEKGVITDMIDMVDDERYSYTEELGIFNPELKVNGIYKVVSDGKPIVYYQVIKHQATELKVKADKQKVIDAITKKTINHQQLQDCFDGYTPTIIENREPSAFNFEFYPDRWEVGYTLNRSAQYKTSDALRWSFLLAVTTVDELKDLTKLKTIVISNVVNQDTQAKLKPLKSNTPEFLYTLLNDTPNGKSIAVSLAEFGLTAKSARYGVSGLDLGKHAHNDIYIQLN